jgi:integrase
VALKVEDYFERKGTHWLRFKEKRGKIHEVPVHSKAKEAIDQLIAASGLGSSAPLFPAFAPDKKSLAIDKKTGGLRHLDRTGIWKLVQARAKASGLEKKVCCHSFRATGITEYLNAEGTIDIAQRIAGHSQLSTTQIYDHSKDRVTIAEIEMVSF